MFRNILVPVDLERPEEWKSALTIAAALASALSARLTISSIVRDASILARGEWLPIRYEQLLVEARWKLEAIASQFDDTLAIDVEVGTGAICGGILEVAERISADLIVLASHRPRASDHVHAANAARVSTRASCSVLIVRPKSDPLPQKDHTPEVAGARL